MRKKTSFRKLVYPLLGAALCILALTSCGAVRALFLLVPNTNDYKRFPNREIHASKQTFQFAATQTNDLGRKLFVQDRFVQNQIFLDDFIEKYHTEAFIIIVHDSIIYEKYPGQRTPEQPVTSFSITKSILSTLVGAAIQDGYIQSVHQSIVDFLPEWKGYEQVQIWDLMQHTSGISFNHSIANLFADEVQFYYGKNLRKRLKKRTVDLEPAKRFDYHSANTQLLALVLEAATQKNVSTYLEEKIWIPLGMEANATWTIDEKSDQAMERAFCCLQARARDFAKLGRLWLHNGQWDNGYAVFADTWLPEILGNGLDYSSGFTPGPAKYHSFFSSGLLGQIIYVFPEKDMIILRFGEHKKGYNINFWKDIMIQIADKVAYASFDN